MKKILATILFFPLFALAYIPSADFIFTKVVQNSGKGVYQIKQEVSFPTAERNITVTETWWIAGENLMFLKAEGPLFNEYYLYKNGKRYFFNSEGKFVASAIPKDFFENLFFYRYSNPLREALINKKILPAQIFKKRPVVKNDKDMNAIINEPYLKLSRLLGSITFLMGYAAQDEKAPGIWIEQDRFLIKKIHFPSDADFVADGFSELSRGLTYPKTQRISWENNQSAVIELSRSDALSKPTSFFEEPAFSKLAAQNKSMPQDASLAVVADFYKRFR
jgi:hypothetical protein